MPNYRNNPDHLSYLITQLRLYIRYRNDFVGDAKNSQVHSMPLSAMLPLCWKLFTILQVQAFINKPLEANTFWKRKTRLNDRQQMYYHVSSQQTTLRPRAQGRVSATCKQYPLKSFRNPQLQDKITSTRRSLQIIWYKLALPITSIMKRKCNQGILLLQLYNTNSKHDVRDHTLRIN